MAKYNIYVEDLSIEALLNKHGGVGAAKRFLREGRVVFDTLTTDEEHWEDAGVKFMSENARALLVGRQIHKTDTTSLNHKPLGEEMTGDEIVTHLGGREKAVISLPSLHKFMQENQGSDDWFLAIVEDENGDLWVVNFDWYCYVRGWRVFADPVSVADRWYAGRCVLSRK